MAIDGNTGRLVVVGLVSAGRMSTLEPALGVKHRHLASIDDVGRSLPEDAFPPDVSLPGGAGVVIAEHVPGLSLRSVLERGALHPAKAVAWVMRLAEAVQALHTAGAIHGAISPRAVIAEPEGRTMMAPVLSQLIAPPLAAFLPPERVRGGAEATTDDVWSLFATLYAALTGASPFHASSRDALLKGMHTRPKPLADFGVNEPALAEILARGLLPERRARVTDLAELVASLDAWERDPKKMPAPRARPKPAALGMSDVASGGALANARDDSLVIDDRELADDQGATPREPAPLPKMPPPLPPSAKTPPKAVRAAPPPLPSSAERDQDRSSPNPAPPVAAEIPLRQRQPPVHFVPVQKRLSWNPFQRKRSVWPWIAAAVPLLGGGAYLLLAPRAAPPVPEVVETVEAPRPKRAPKPAQQLDAAVALNECVAAHFPQDSLPPNTDFSAVCAEGDFVVITRDLFSLATLPAAKPEEKRPGLGLDWYELPATAIIRRTCCPSAPVTNLTDTPGKRCEQIGQVVQRIADDSAKSVDLAPGARLFDKTAGCLVANRVPHGYPYERAPKAASRAAFQEFLSRAAIIGARR